MKKILTTWDWKREPEAPLKWTDPERHVVLLEGDVTEDGGAAGQGRRVMALAVAGATLVGWTRAAWKFCLLGPKPQGVYPALLVSAQGELERELPSLLQAPAERSVLLLEPTEALDLGLLIEVARSRAGGFFSLDDGESGEPGAGVRRLSWVIVRGGAAPLHPAWVRSIRDQCAAAGVPFCFLGWGDWVPICDALPGHERMASAEAHLWANGQVTIIGSEAPQDLRELAKKIGLPVLAYRVGAKRSGRTLDDVEHLASPWGDVEVAS